MISRAFQTLISPSSSSRSTTWSKMSGSAPAVAVTDRACSVMWPCWMPSVANALSAEKFCARPTVAMIWASSVADFTPRIWWFSFTAGFDISEPPTMPTFMGISMLPTRLPSASAVQLVSEV